ncbi:MAG: hypothetical protein KTR22_04755 [Flavobacteriaceae bacterium]|nr:hypothetical protein [Flavobacteriaceae bacterium]
MKTIKYLVCAMLLALSFMACESEETNQETLTADMEEKFFEGKTEGKISLGKRARCGVLGPVCGSPNQTLSYFYMSPATNPTITWTVDSGAMTLISGQGTSNATFSLGSSFSGGQITVTGVGEPDCNVTLEVLLCGAPECEYTVAVLDEYIDGTQSGANFVYLHAGGNFPPGTTYAWTITRQDGSVQNYAASTANPRLVSASISNRIVSATVTAVYEDCEETSTNNFACAIPNSDANGDLFPECL